jgi:phage shock protein A
MATLFQKIRTITLGNLHALADKVIDLNSIAAIKQHIRDLEEAKEEIADSAAVAKARVTELNRDIKVLELKKQETDENITLVLSDGDESNDHLAEPLEQRLMGYEEELTAKSEELAEATEVSTSLASATSKLSAKHQEMLSNLRRLEALDRSAKAKEKAASAITQAARAGSSAPSVDNVERRLRERATVAGARFDRAMGEMTDSVDTGVMSAQAKQRIAARRAKLAAQAAPAAEAAAPKAASDAGE